MQYSAVMDRWEFVRLWAGVHCGTPPSDRERLRQQARRNLALKERAWAREQYRQDRATLRAVGLPAVSGPSPSPEPGLIFVHRE